MVNLAIEDRLVHYFLAMGAQQTGAPQGQHNNLTFLSGSDRISVVILKSEEVAQGNRIIESLLSLAALRGYAQFLYLAAPRLIGASVDAAIFRAHGIGLLLFDDRRIDEALAAPSVRTSESQPQGLPGVGKEVVAELAALKSMYAEMERSVAKLQGDLEALRKHESQDATTEHLSPSSFRPERMFMPPDNPIAALPAFFVNNPWLDVLAKRGRPGDGSVAG